MTQEGLYESEGLGFLTRASSVLEVGGERPLIIQG